MGLDIWFSKTSNQELGSFRKVNFLVKYFSKLGLDVENQTPLEVHEDDIIELLDRCNQVLEDYTKAKDLLPTMNGFFFGSIEYDDDYFENVKKVKEFLETSLIPEFKNLSLNESINFVIWY